MHNNYYRNFEVLTKPDQQRIFNDKRQVLEIFQYKGENMID